MAASGGMLWHRCVVVQMCVVARVCVVRGVSKTHTHTVAGGCQSGNCDLRSHFPRYGRGPRQNRTHCTNRHWQRARVTPPVSHRAPPRVWRHVPCRRRGAQRAQRAASSGASAASGSERQRAQRVAACAESAASAASGSERGERSELSPGGLTVFRERGPRPAPWPSEIPAQLHQTVCAHRRPATQVQPCAPCRWTATPPRPTPHPEPGRTSSVYPGGPRPTLCSNPNLS